MGRGELRRRAEDEMDGKDDLMAVQFVNAKQFYAWFEVRDYAELVTRGFEICCADFYVD